MSRIPADAHACPRCYDSGPVRFCPDSCAAHRAERVLQRSRLAGPDPPTCRIRTTLAGGPLPGHLAPATLITSMNPKNILCYGDSNTWGLNPADASRYDRSLRWPGVLATLLDGDFHVVEEGLVGRTTVRDDPNEAHKNGLTYLPPCLESHHPLDLVVLMLGTNDLKQRFALSPEAVASGVQVLIETILASPCGTNSKAPQVLLLAPPHVAGLSALAEMFAGAEEKSSALAPLYTAVAQETGCHFLDAGPVAPVSPLDGVHLDAESHARLAQAVATRLRAILSCPHPVKVA